MSEQIGNKKKKTQTHSLNNQEKREEGYSRLENNNKRDYYELFEYASLALWETDFSAVREYIERLKEVGVQDFRQYFRKKLSIFEECIHLIKILDANQEAVSLNKASSKTELIERVWDLYTEKTMLSFQKAIVAFIEEERVISFQTTTKTLGGKNIYQTMQWMILPGYENSWGRVIISVQDIGNLQKAQLRLESSESSYQDLFNSIEDAIYIQDINGRFLDVNLGAEELYGIPKKEFIGKTPEFLSAPGKNDMEEITRKIEKSLNGDPQEIEFWGKKSNGEIFPKEVRAFKGNYYGKDVIITLGREITQRKDDEASLKRQLNELNILQATAFVSTQAINQDDLIRKITDILGNTLYSDNIGVLLLDEETQIILPHPSYQGVSLEDVFKSYPLSEGVSGRVASTGKALRIPDVSQYPEYIEVTSTTRSELCVPIKIGKKVLGVINAESSKEDFFTKEDERLLNTIAGQMAISIEKIHLLETEQKRRQVAEKLQKAAAILTTTLDQDQATALILKELSHVVSFDSASIQILGGGYLKIIGGVGNLVLDKEKSRHFPYPGDNPNTVVIETSKPLILGNAPEAYPAFLEMPSIQSWLGVPLTSSDGTIGILSLDSGKTDHFTEEDARLVMSFANHATIAIENARLFNAEKKRRHEAEILRETALAITSSLNLKESIHHILEQLSRVLPYDSASIQILDGDELQLFGGRGWRNPEDLTKIRFPIDGSNPNTRVILEKKIVILDDVSADYENFNLPPYNHILSWMGIPLLIRGKVIGMLAVDSRKKSYFTEESIDITRAFANQAAIAVENARLFDTEKRRRQEAETLQKAAIIINSALSLDMVLENIAKQITTSIGVTGCAISSWNKKNGTISTLIDYSKLSPEQADPIGKTYLLKDFPFSQRVLETKESAIIQREDVHIDAAETALMAELDYSRLLLLPMITGEEIIGLVELYEEGESKRGAYTDEEINLIKGLVSHAAIAIENARLFDAEKTRRQEAETLRQAAQTVSSSLKLQEVLDTIFASIKRTIPYDSAAIMLIEGDKVRLTGGYNLQNIEAQIGRIFPSDNPLSLKITKSIRPLIISDVRGNPHFMKWAGTDYVRGWMGIPLIVRGKVIGHITLDSREVDAYQEKDAELAQTLAHQAASAIENARLYEEALHTAERHEILHRLSQDILRDIQSPDATYKAIHRATEKLMICDAFVISLREKNEEDDLAIYLVDLGKRYNARKALKQGSIISLVERIKGSFIQKDLETGDLFLEENRFGSKRKVRSILISPMYVGEKLIGAISAQSYSAYTYDEEEQILLEMLASHAAAAIENARLFSETERRGKEFAELYEITQDLVIQQDLKSLLKTTLARAARLLDVSSGDIYLYNKSTKTLTPVTVYGFSADDEEKFLHTPLSEGEGMAGYVASTLEPFHIDDYQAWINRSREFEDIPFTSVLGVPMLYAGNLIGVLNFHEVYPNTRIFTESDERTMTLFATQVAGAVHSVRQFEEINHRLAELEAVNRTSIALRSAETPEEMLPILLDEICKSLSVEVSSIWLGTENSKEVHRDAACGWLENILPDRHASDVGLIGHIFHSGESYIAADLRNDPHIQLTEGFEIPESWTGAWVPIRSTNTITGVISIMAKQPREFNEENTRLLTTLAEMFGNAIHRARLHERTNEQVTHLAALRNIDSAISLNFDLNITLQLLVEHTVTQLNLAAADILLWNTPDETLEYFVGSGFKTTHFQNTSLKSNEGLPGRILKKRNIQSVTQPHNEKDCSRRSWFITENFLSYYCVPLIAKGEIFGVLEAFLHEETTSPPLEWLDFLQTLAGQATIAIDNNYLFKDLKTSNKELALAYDTTLEGWGKALELRDRDTQGHTINVTELTLRLAREMGVAEADLIHVYRGALLHDIGKMGIPDDILRKAGPLTKDEWKIMREHPQYAYDMLSPISYLRSAIDIPYCHHERWDGNGYPRGLKREEIPLAARIFSVIDVWDALLANRPYREAWEKKTIVDYLRNERETRFDPEIVETFLKMVGEA